MREIVVSTGARLHFGLLSVSPESDRQYGGIGLMIDSPGIELVARCAEQDCVRGPEDAVTRVPEFLCRLRKSINVPPCEIEIRNAIPPHTGLGSGTQLALAAARAATALFDLTVGTESLAQTVGRGARSAVGVHGFDAGGFLIDGGKAESDVVGQLATRIEFPADWRIILVMQEGTLGLAGSAEATAFRQMKPIPSRLTDQLCRLIVMRMMPALLREDFRGFAEELSEYGRRIGHAFADCQDGGHMHPQSLGLAQQLEGNGVAGIAQSSWGPTFAIVCPSQAAADSTVGLIRQLDTNPNRAVRIVEARNHGATVRVSS